MNFPFFSSLSLYSLVLAVIHIFHSIGTVGIFVNQTYHATSTHRTKIKRQTHRPRNWRKFPIFIAAHSTNIAARSYPYILQATIYNFECIRPQLRFLAQAFSSNNRLNPMHIFCCILFVLPPMSFG